MYLLSQDSDLEEDDLDSVSDTDSIMVPARDMVPEPNAQVPPEDVFYGWGRARLGQNGEPAVGGWGRNWEDGSYVPRLVHHGGGVVWGRNRNWRVATPDTDNPQNEGD